MPSNRLANDPFNIIFCGVGGQGNVLSARLIGQSFSRLGYHVSIGETYGASQRGGSVMSHIRISAEQIYGPLIPIGMAHVVVGLEPMETLRVLADYGNPRVITIANTREVTPVGVNMGLAKYPQQQELSAALSELSKRLYLIDATKMALEMGTPIVANFIMTGALCGLDAIPPTTEVLEQVMRESLPASSIALNLSAFRKGIQQVAASA